jgi:hypothetical protein
MAYEELGSIPGWHYGLDPWAPGMTIRSVTRERHTLGEALRIELGPALGDGRIHLQWYIATRMGPWAMWTACGADEAASREAVLREVVWFGPEKIGEPLAGLAR